MSFTRLRQSILSRLLIVLLGVLISMTCQAVGRGAKKTKTSEEWAPYEQWLELEPRCKQLVADIKKANMPLYQVAFASEGTPEFFRSTRLQELLNDVLTYAGEWLESQNFKGAPTVKGYEGVPLPKNATNLLLDYITTQDSILLPALTHLIHLARSKDSPLSAEEKKFLEFRLRWLNEVELPEGITIDWKQEYKTLLADYKDEEEWQNRVTIPSSATMKALEERAGLEPEHEFLTKHLRDSEYDNLLDMKTTWKALLTLHNAGMTFDDIDTSDPLLKSHIQFAIAASLYGSYMDDNERKLGAYWIRASELQLKLQREERCDWGKLVRQYTPLGAKLRTDFILFAPDESGAAPVKSRRKKTQPAGTVSKRSRKLPSHHDKKHTKAKPTNAFYSSATTSATSKPAQVTSPSSETHVSQSGPSRIPPIKKVRKETDGGKQQTTFNVSNVLNSMELPTSSAAQPNKKQVMMNQQYALAPTNMPPRPPAPAHYWAGTSRGQGFLHRGRGTFNYHGMVRGHYHHGMVRGHYHSKPPHMIHGGYRYGSRPQHLHRPMRGGTYAYGSPHQNHMYPSAGQFPQSEMTKKLGPPPPYDPRAGSGTIHHAPPTPVTSHTPNRPSLIMTGLPWDEKGFYGTKAQ